MIGFGTSDLARVVETLSENPESPNTVRRASAAAAGVARQVARGEDLGVPYPRLALAVEGIRLAASDVATLAAVEGGGFEAPPRATKAGGREGYELETTLFQRVLSRDRKTGCA